MLASGARLIVSAKEVEPASFTALSMRAASCWLTWSVTGEDLAEVTGATLCEHLDDLTAESLGSLDRFSVETLEGDEGRRERLIFEHANSRLACIDVGGSGHGH